ncbi:hypothetical protein ANCCEY_08792 [Ancylostoma ceylanicum]|uniref:Uncharacterized protein n=1 Tax=Ancylostoma ceylanicum TaxID=53326 RepID=A0A0D6LLQ5_9BILA|nr:hypothetical protein ANCCEY_08792 [Ancylostoma ceylanicum]
MKWADDELVKKRLAEEGFSNDEALKEVTRSDRTTHVYEGGFKLGCGAGLPGILCALRGAAHVTFHDFVKTIYNSEDYEALHDAFDYALSPTGVIWVAAKIFYFGVGGNVPLFMEYVEKRGVFRATMKQTIQADVMRAIVELRRISVIGSS